jgi:hypothetical protein
LLLKLQITENETTLFSEVGYGYEWWVDKDMEGDSRGLEWPKKCV